MHTHAPTCLYMHADMAVVSPSAPLPVHFGTLKKARLGVRVLLVLREKFLWTPEQACSS